MTDETDKLAALASEINALHWSIEEGETDKRLELARQLADAYALCPTPADWRAWAGANLDLSREYREKMLRIGQAADPAVALARMREANRKAEANRRAKAAGPRGSKALKPRDTVDIELPAELADCTEQQLRQCLRAATLRRKHGVWVAAVPEPEPPAADPQAEPAEEAEQKVGAS